MAEPFSSAHPQPHGEDLTEVLAIFAGILRPEVEAKVARAIESRGRYVDKLDRHDAALRDVGARQTRNAAQVADFDTQIQSIELALDSLQKQRLEAEEEMKRDEAERNEILAEREVTQGYLRHVDRQLESLRSYFSGFQKNLFAPLACETLDDNQRRDEAGPDCLQPEAISHDPATVSERPGHDEAMPGAITPSRASPDHSLSGSTATESDARSDCDVLPCEGNRKRHAEDMLSPTDAQPVTAMGQADMPEKRTTITFEEVFQDGHPEDTIQIYPPGTDEYCIFRCPQHPQSRFRSQYPVGSAAQHLTGVEHRERESRSLARAKLGVRVLGCDDEKMARNNRAASIAVGRSKSRTAPSGGARHRIRSAETKSGTTLLGTEPDDDALHLDGEEEEPLFEPRIGEVCKGFWRGGEGAGQWFAVVRLPLDGLSSVTMDGSLHRLYVEMSKTTRQCYVMEGDQPIGWRPDFQLGGRLVHKRQYPVLFLEERLRFPASGSLHIADLVERINALSWLEQHTIRPLDAKDPMLLEIANSSTMFQYLTRLKHFGKLSSAGQEQLEMICRGPADDPDAVIPDALPASSALDGLYGPGPLAGADLAWQTPPRTELACVSSIVVLPDPGTASASVKAASRTDPAAESPPQSRATPQLVTFASTSDKQPSMEDCQVHEPMASKGGWDDAGDLAMGKALDTAPLTEPSDANSGLVRAAAPLPEAFEGILLPSPGYQGTTSNIALPSLRDGDGRCRSPTLPRDEVSGAQSGNAPRALEHDGSATTSTTALLYGGHDASSATPSRHWAKRTKPSKGLRCIPCSKRHRLCDGAAPQCTSQQIYSFPA